MSVQRLEGAPHAAARSATLQRGHHTHESGPAVRSASLVPSLRATHRVFSAEAPSATLRLESPFRHHMRSVTKDTTLGDEKSRKSKLAC